MTGIDEVRAGLMPDEKLKAIEELRDSRGATAMVGDGLMRVRVSDRKAIGISVFPAV